MISLGISTVWKAYLQGLQELFEILFSHAPQLGYGLYSRL